MFIYSQDTEQVKKGLEQILVFLYLSFKRILLGEETAEDSHQYTDNILNFLLYHPFNKVCFYVFLSVKDITEKA